MKEKLKNKSLLPQHYNKIGLTSLNTEFLPGGGPTIIGLEESPPVPVTGGSPTSESLLSAAHPTFPPPPVGGLNRVYLEADTRVLL